MAFFRENVNTASYINVLSHLNVQYSVQYTVNYIVQYSVQCSVEYIICMRGVQALIGLQLEDKGRPNGHCNSHY